MLTVYWKNATAEVVGAKHGISDADLKRIDRAMTQALQTVVAQCKDGTLGYAALPGHKEYPAGVDRLVQKLKPNTTDLVVLGIGGSALGNIALQAALNPATYNLLPDGTRPGPRLFVLDNVDPAMIADVIDFVKPRLATTVVNVISKSGETAETASQFMIFRNLMKRALGAGFAERIVATTDAEKGTLHGIAKADGYEMLIVPGDVGGRFSVLSQVGLFSAAMCGIDTAQLLAGAAAMERRVQKLDWHKNPAAMLAAIKFLAYARKGKVMHVMMPYANRLYLLADWYRQLWAESLGKRSDRQGKRIYTGPTPIKALGTTDQHSQVQLYREGPNDKLTVFLEVAQHPAEVKIPRMFGKVPGLSYLRGRQIADLLNAEKTATEYAMACSKRPSMTIRFDEITPRTVGEFLYLYEFTTSLMGELLNINAYDQPAVELGKKATFALMGRDGHEEMARKIKPFAKVDRARRV